MLLQDRVAIVTGGAQGIGLAIAETLHTDGATVVVADLDGEPRRARRHGPGGPGRGRACNVVEEASVEALVDGVVDRHGRLDVLVNNAGITRDAMMHKHVPGRLPRGRWTCICRARGCARGRRWRTCGRGTAAAPS